MHAMRWSSMSSILFLAILAGCGDGGKTSAPPPPSSGDTSGVGAPKPAGDESLARVKKADVLKWAQRILATRWHVIQPEAISQHQADALLYLAAWERAHEEMRPEYNIKGGTRGKYFSQYGIEEDPRLQNYRDAVKENLLK